MIAFEGEAAQQGSGGVVAGGPAARPAALRLPGKEQPAQRRLQRRAPLDLGPASAHTASTQATTGTGPIHDHQLMVLTRRKPPPTRTAICAGV